MKSTFCFYINFLLKFIKECNFLFLVYMHYDFIFFKLCKLCPFLLLFLQKRKNIIVNNIISINSREISNVMKLCGKL